MKQLYRSLFYSVFDTKAITRVSAVLRTSQWKPAVMHTYVTNMVATAVGVPPSWVLMTNSCTSALTAAYYFNPNIRVSVPLMTYSATAAPARLLGREVHSVDVDDAGWSVEDTTVAVDLWGRAAPTGLQTRILDAAHRFAGEEHAALADRGVAICYSFGPQKEVSCPQGGALVWSAMEDAETREQVEAFINYGQRGRVATGRGGICGWMPEPTAVLLGAHMAKQQRQKDYSIRQSLLETYDSFLGTLLLTKPGEASGHVAVVLLPDEGSAKAVRATFKRLQIECGHHYPIGTRYAGTNAYALSRRILTLPCHTHMVPKDAAKIARTVLTA